MNNSTKIQIIREALENGRYVSDRVAHALCETYRLSAIIHELRHRYGMDVRDRWVVNEYTGSRYKEYFLNPKTITKKKKGHTENGR